MKKCTYCRREYPDETTVCPLDGRLLVAPAAPRSRPVMPVRASRESQADSAAPENAPGEDAGRPDGAAPVLAEHWTVRRAWLCILTISVGMLLVATVWAFLRSSPWSRGIRVTNVDVVVAILGMMVPLGIALSFSGVTSLRQFVDAFGLRRPRREHMAAALALGFVTQAITIELLGGGLDKLQLRWRLDWLCVGALLAPFQEEPVLRGYLYTAFRTRYSSAAATGLITLLTLFTHLPMLLRSPEPALPIALLGAVTCVFRERTGNLWPAVVFHLGFNAIPAGSMW